jgi:hypothetical protein
MASCATKGIISRFGSVSASFSSALAVSFESGSTSALNCTGMRWCWMLCSIDGTIYFFCSVVRTVLVVVMGGLFVVARFDVSGDFRVVVVCTLLPLVVVGGEGDVVIIGKLTFTAAAVVVNGDGVVSGDDSLTAALTVVDVVVDFGAFVVDEVVRAAVNLVAVDCLKRV